MTAGTFKGAARFQRHSMIVVSPWRHDMHSAASFPQPETPGAGSTSSKWLGPRRPPAGQPRGKDIRLRHAVLHARLDPGPPPIRRTSPLRGVGRCMSRPRQRPALQADVDREPSIASRSSSLHLGDRPDFRYGPFGNDVVGGKRRGHPLGPDSLILPLGEDIERIASCRARSHVTIIPAGNRRGAKTRSFSLGRLGPARKPQQSLGAARIPRLQGRAAIRRHQRVAAVQAIVRFPPRCRFGPLRRR